MSDAPPRPNRVAEARIPPQTIVSSEQAAANDNRLLEVAAASGDVSAVVFVHEDAGQADAADVISDLERELLSTVQGGRDD